MPLTYGGAPLFVPPRDILAWVESTFSLADLVPFHHRPDQPQSWPTVHDFRRRPVKVNTLWWPTGAARWAIGTYLVAEEDLATIRNLAYAASTYQALTLTIDDGTYSVGPSMWMLPAIPLTQDPPDNASRVDWTLPRSLETIPGTSVKENNLYLLPLVDARYFWWEKSASITVTEGTTTWATLFTAIASALGITLTQDSVPAAYLKPTVELRGAHEQLPVLLDAAALSVGMRVVAKLDGTYLLQSATSARAVLEAQLGAYHPRLAGGLLALDVAA